MQLLGLLRAIVLILVASGSNASCAAPIPFQVAKESNGSTLLFGLGKDISYGVSFEGELAKITFDAALAINKKKLKSQFPKNIILKSVDKKKNVTVLVLQLPKGATLTHERQGDFIQLKIVLADKDAPQKAPEKKPAVLEIQDETVRVSYHFHWPTTSRVVAYTDDTLHHFIFDQLFDDPTIKQEVIKHSSVDVPARVTSSVSTHYTLPVHEGVRVTLVYDVDHWVVLSQEGNQALTVPCAHNIQPHIMQQAREVLLPAAEVAGTIMVQSSLGMPQMAIPLASPGCIANDLSFIDFRLKKTMQGLLVEPITPSLEAKIGPDGVHLTTPQGLVLSDGKPASLLPKSTLRFDLKAWQMEDKTLSQARQQLEKDVLNATPIDRLKNHLALLEFFIANGMSHEADGLLHVIQEAYPVLLGDDLFKGLDAMTSFLNKDYDRTIALLSGPLFDQQVDSPIWKGASLIHEKKIPEGLKLLASGIARLRDYPGPLKTMFAFIGADTATRVKDKFNAQNFLSLIDQSHLTSTQKGKFDLEQGELSLASSNAEEGQKSLEKSVKGGNLRAAAEAELILVLEGVKSKKLSFPEAISRLEHLQNMWRGDLLEFQVLQALGDYYQQQGDARRSLTAYERALKFFAYLPDAKVIHPTMVTQFKAYFDRKDLSPLSAVALYERFSTLTPDGADGDKLILNLCQRLFDLNLADQAVRLLQSRIDAIKQTPNPGYGPTLLALELALVEAHIRDHQAQKASSVIKKIDEAALSEAQKKQLQLLKISLTHVWDGTEDLIASLNQEHDPAFLVEHAYTYANLKKWKEASLLFAKAAATWESQKKPIPERVLLDWAASLSLAGNTQGLQELWQKYQGKVDPKTKTTLSIMVGTSTDKGPIDLSKAADQLKDLKDFDDFMKAYKEKKP